MRIEERALAVGGVHALEGTEPCHLTKVEPASSLEDLHGKDVGDAVGILRVTARP